MSETVTSGTGKEYKAVESGPSGISKYIKPAELTELEGVYAGILPGKFGDSYKVELDNGELVAVNGAKTLNDAMQNIETGTQVLIKNMGQGIVQSGPYKGKPFHNIKVFVA